MEVEQAALFGEQESEILLGCDLRDLPERLVLGVVIAGLGAAVTLLFEVKQPPLGNAERLVDGFVQVRVLVLAQQVLGFVADDEVAAAGNTELNVDHRRDGAGEILGALIDPHPARDQPVVELFEIGDPRSDLLLRPIGTFDIVEGDLQRYLQHRRLHILGAFVIFINAWPA